jgi:hypothetical protein
MHVSSLEVWNDLRQPDRVVVLDELNWVIVGEGDQQGCLILGRDNHWRRRGGSGRWDCSRHGRKKRKK